MASELTDRSVIAVSGPEARSFLQGLITNDVNALTPDHPLYAALLSPQGKILFDFLLSESDDALLIDCQKNAREALIKRLIMYKLRAKVEIKPRDDLGVFMAGDGPTDPRLRLLGGRSVRPKVPSEPADDFFRSVRLGLGVPEGDDFGSERMFALDAGLDELHAISFEKGCYVGQELTARMKHRGKDRKRLLPIVADEGQRLPERDVPVTAAGVEIGTIASVYGRGGFALIRLDRLNTASLPLEAAGVPVNVTKPDWLFT